MGIISRERWRSNGSHEGHSQKSIEEKIEEYIANQRCVLWGQTYDIYSKEGRKQAKEFILDLLIDLEVTKEEVV